MDSWSEISNLSAEATLAPKYVSFDSETYTLINAIAYSISTVLAVVLNLINIIIIPQVKESFGENTRLCLLTLSVVDFLTGLICSSSGVIFVYVPLIAGVRIPLVISCTAFVWMSMLILTVASVDRYIAVTRPFQYPTLISRERMICFLVFVVVAALANSGASYLHSLFRQECHPFSGVCTTIKPTFAVYVILVFVAVITTTYVNIRLVIIARRHERQIAALEASVRAGGVALPPPSGAGLKGLTTVLVLTAAFYVAWLPGLIVSFAAPINGLRIPPYVTLATRYAIICNSWWNAAVYWILNKPYRSTCLKLMRRLCWCPGNIIRRSEVHSVHTVHLSHVEQSSNR